MYMSIGQATVFLGVAVVTLHRWEKIGRRLPAWRTPGGHRRYTVEDLNEMSGQATPARKTIGYARVASHGQKDDLQRQADRLAGYATTQAYTHPEIITDLARKIHGDGGCSPSC